jgi:sugar phosphate isomerase/epimerase
MKYSVILSNVGSCCDRYMPSGYNRKYTTRELFERLSKIKGVTGVELIGGSNITKDNIAEIKEYLEEFNLKAVAIIPDHFGSMKWGKGAFTNPDISIREQAVEETISMAECAKRIGCNTISIWNGQDGFDYPFQVDYDFSMQCLVDGIKACAKAIPDIQFSLEYKPKEPRNHSFISNVYSTLMLVNDIGLENVGVTIDTGHAAVAYENLAFAAVECQKRGKLFHVHYNDNYGLWDDDMIAGSIHTIEFIEFVWWLKKTNYAGYVSVDQYPYREDSQKAVNESVRWMMAFEKAAEKIDNISLENILKNNDAIQSTAMLREIIFGKDN